MAVQLAPIPAELVRLSDELQSLGGGDAFVSKVHVTARLVAPAAPTESHARVHALSVSAAQRDTITVAASARFVNCKSMIICLVSSRFVLMEGLQLYLSRSSITFAQHATDAGALSPVERL